MLDGTLHMVAEDNEGALTGHERYGAHLISKDGIEWTRHDPIQVYTHTLYWDDGTSTQTDRRERPELFNADGERKGNGQPTHLITAVKVGDKTWCHIQVIAPPE